MSPSANALALADVLVAEAALFGELADLAVRQRAALLVADADRLNSCAARAETLATRFRMLDGERARLERDPLEENSPELTRARATLLGALGRLLSETTVCGTVVKRLQDTVMDRQAAVGGLFGTTYLPNGTVQASTRTTGTALLAEG